jgi:hypothetical protein
MVIVVPRAKTRRRHFVKQFARIFPGEPIDRQLFNGWRKLTATHATLYFVGIVVNYSAIPFILYLTYRLA